MGHTPKSLDRPYRNQVMILPLEVVHQTNFEGLFGLPILTSLRLPHRSNLV